MIISPQGLCLSTLPGTFFTALFMAGFETKFSCQQLSYIWMTHFSIRWLSLTIVLQMKFKHRPLEMEASDWKTWRWKWAMCLPGEDIPGRERALQSGSAWCVVKWSRGKENWRKVQRAQIKQLKEGEKKISCWLRITWNMAKNCEEAKTLNLSPAALVKPGLGTCGLCDLGGAMGQTSWWQRACPNKTKNGNS